MCPHIYFRDFIGHGQFVLYPFRKESAFQIPVGEVMEACKTACMDGKHIIQNMYGRPLMIARPTNLQRAKHILKSQDNDELQRQIKAMKS